jgi:hypothetical protein
VLIGNDERNAGRAPDFLDAVNVYARLPKAIDQLGAKGILAHFADHGYGITQFCSSDRLIGPFATKECVEDVAEDGFSGNRQTIGSGDEIDVDAANDNNRLEHSEPRFP